MLQSMGRRDKKFTSALDWFVLDSESILPVCEEFKTSEDGGLLNSYEF